MTQTPIPPNEGRVCKFCRMGIDQKAIVCPHCRHRLTKPIWFIWIVLVLILALIAGAFLIANEVSKEGEETTRQINEENAQWQALHKDVKEALGEGKPEAAIQQPATAPAPIAKAPAKKPKPIMDVSAFAINHEQFLNKPVRIKGYIVDAIIQRGVGAILTLGTHEGSVRYSDGEFTIDDMRHCVVCYCPDENAGKHSYSYPIAGQMAVISGEFTGDVQQNGMPSLYGCVIEKATAD
jgi:hypothetical protein